MQRDALISECGKYRYKLRREWAQSERMPVLWVMLNPSTADGSIDDPTIRRCIAFTKSWGYGALWVGNVYAYRSTDPAALWGMAADDARGAGNYGHLWDMASQSALTVCAWGAHASASARILQNISGPGGLWCLGKTKSGQPRHPLYVKGDTALQEYR
jgi:hypothetical protein